MTIEANRRHLRGAILGLVAPLLVFSSSPLASQAGHRGRAAVDGPAPTWTGPELRAEALRAVAVGGEAADAGRRLAERAALLVADPFERARTLHLAGRLYWHDGDLRRARRTLTRAGRVAYSGGHPELAVRLFLDAAQAATEDGRRRAAWRAAQRAGKVIHAAGFTTDERLRLLTRVVYTDQPANFQTEGPLVSH